jgi:hypothetical protein
MEAAVGLAVGDTTVAGTQASKATVRKRKTAVFIAAYYMTPAELVAVSPVTQEWLKAWATQLFTTGTLRTELREIGEGFLRALGTLRGESFENPTQFSTPL